MTSSVNRVAYITAGAAGMFCGSCLHDNTLARALTELGVDVQLIPTYTPIRTDERDVSIDRVFYGGINVYLQQRVPLFRYLPRAVDRLLDQPWLIRWATSRGIDIQPAELGALTVSMLRGSLGYQRKEVRRLCDWLARAPRPQIVNFSNILIAGCAPDIRKRLRIPTLVTLQGDDIFLEELPEPYKSRAFKEIHRLVADIDGFIVFTKFYADFMSDYLDIPRDKFHIVPLGLDTSDFPTGDSSADDETSRVVDGKDSDPGGGDPGGGEAGGGDPDGSGSAGPRIGYLARLAPEKGLHLLVDAFIQLRGMAGMSQAHLEIAGWMGEHRRAYAEEQFDKLRHAGLEDAFTYHGTVDRHDKLQFLGRLDAFSVPTVYRDPKGLFLLEAWAAAVPVVQPRHGAFPEMLAAVGGGRLVRPNDPAHLATTLHDLLSDPSAAAELGRQARDVVRRQFGARAMAEATREVFEHYVGTDR